MSKNLNGSDALKKIEAKLIYITDKTAFRLIAKFIQVKIKIQVLQISESEVNLNSLNYLNDSLKDLNYLMFYFNIRITQLLKYYSIKN